MLTTYASFWDDFTDPLKVTFDGENRLILLNVEFDTFSVKGDLYSASKRWLQRRDNSKYLPPMRVVGGDPVGGGLFAGDLYFLINGWQVVVRHTVKMTGILYQDNTLLETYVVQPGGGVTATVANLAYAYEQTSTGGGGTAEPDWTDEEKRQIRFRLGLDGLRTPPTTTDGTLPNIPRAVWTQPPVTTPGSIGEYINQVGQLVEAVPGSVWDEPTSAHLLPGSAGEAAAQTKANTETTVITTVTTLDMVNTVMKYSNNRTKIDTTTNQLIIYDTDNVTPIQIFNLRDRNGVPSTVESMERIPTI